MPLPFLLIPIAAAAAASATPPAVLVGGGVVAGGVGASFFWLFFAQKERPSSEHQASLVAQSKITQKQINDTKKAVESVVPLLKIVAAEVNEAMSATTASVSSFHQSSEKILQTSRHLQEVTQVMEESSDTLVVSLPALKGMSKKTQEDVLEATAKCDELNGLLSQKEGEITQAYSCIKLLKATVDKQAVATTELEVTVETQKQLFDKMDKKNINLTAEAKRSAQSCQFFTQVAQQTLSAQRLPQLSSPNDRVWNNLLF